MGCQGIDDILDIESFAVVKFNPFFLVCGADSILTAGTSSVFVRSGDADGAWSTLLDLKFFRAGWAPVEDNILATLPRLVSAKISPAVTAVRIKNAIPITGRYRNQAIAIVKNAKGAAIRSDKIPVGGFGRRVYPNQSIRRA
jgi:hypothetical protein